MPHSTLMSRNRLSVQGTVRGNYLIIDVIWKCIYQSVLLMNKEVWWKWKHTGPGRDPRREEMQVSCESGSQQLSGEFMPAWEQVLQLPVPQFPHCKMGQAEKDALADSFGFRVSKSPIQSTEFQMGLFIPFLMQLDVTNKPKYFTRLYFISESLVHEFHGILYFI